MVAAWSTEVYRGCWFSWSTPNGVVRDRAALPPVTTRLAAPVGPPPPQGAAPGAPPPPGKGRKPPLDKDGNPLGEPVFDGEPPPAGSGPPGAGPTWPPR